MQPPYILETTNWKQVRSTKYSVAILPWGATEPHNFHLPYGTDTIETARIAKESASVAWSKGAKIMVLPPIHLGLQNPGQVDLPFCLNASLSTQKAILKDILKSLQRQGIKKFILLNGHGGNNFKGILRELSLKFEDMKLFLMEWFRMLDLGEYFDDRKNCDHAGEMETSIFLHYFPELVLDVEKEAGDGKSKPFTLKGLTEKIAWTPRNWAKTSADTGVGNPKTATKEKGERFLKVLVTKISNFFIELDSCDVENDLYSK